jgi:hypothetical protein
MLLLNILISIDQFANTILGGSPDETISSRVGRNAIQGKKWALIAEKVINWIFWDLVKEENHCRNRIEWDEFKPKP